MQPNLLVCGHSWLLTCENKRQHRPGLAGTDGRHATCDLAYNLPPVLYTIIVAIFFKPENRVHNCVR